MDQSNISIELIIRTLTLFVSALYFIQLLISKGLKKLSNRLILSFFGFFTIILLFFKVLEYDVVLIWMLIVPLFVFSVLALAPTIYLYTICITDQLNNRKIAKHYILGGSIALLSLAIELSFFAVTDHDYTFLSDMLLIVSGWSVSICFLIQNIYYIYHSIKIYKSHTINRKNIFSYEEDIKLNWLKILIYGYVIFVSVIVVFKLLGGHPSGFLYYLIIMIYLIYTGYNALKQENIYSVIQHQKAKLNELSDPIIDRNQLPTEKDKELKDRLLDLMEKEKVYLDQEINIFQLADQLNSNSKYLSQAINKG